MDFPSVDDVIKQILFLKARENIRKTLKEKDQSFFGKTELTVRINSMSSGFVGEFTTYSIHNQLLIMAKFR